MRHSFVLSALICNHNKQKKIRKQLTATSATQGFVRAWINKLNIQSYMWHSYEYNRLFNEFHLENRFVVTSGVACKLTNYSYEYTHTPRTTFKGQQDIVLHVVNKKLPTRKQMCLHFPMRKSNIMIQQYILQTTRCVMVFACSAKSSFEQCHQLLQFA